MTAPESSPWAPFKRRAFTVLWLGVMISSIGTWAQTVGAQWLFVNDPNATAIVPLVQTASTLPIMLFALPAGVLADAFDRRWLLFAVQVYAVVVATLLCILTALGMMPPMLLLAFTFAVGIGQAVLLPTWQPLISELVPRTQMAAATRLDMVSVNVARAAGPAIAGFLIAGLGVPLVFGFNALTALPLITALLVWRRKRSANSTRERFLPALRAGGRYVRHEPVVRTIIIRLALFVAPGTAMWALLPLIASRELGLDASGYGLLFAALGLGAVAGALAMGRIKQLMSSNAIVSAAVVLLGVSLAGIVLLPSLPIALVLLVLCGFGWTATASVLMATLQLFLPGWVRARALAVYMMTFTGTQAIVSPIWGLLTTTLGLRNAILLAGGLVVLLNVGAGALLRLPEEAGGDRSVLVYWGAAPDIGDIEIADGPVIVSVEMQVAPENETAFLTAMQDMRRSRLRSGAFRWEIYRVVEKPGTFVEQFTVGSWEEHLHQHQVRLTEDDKAIEDKAFSYLSGPTHGRHMIPPLMPDDD